MIDPGLACRRDGLERRRQTATGLPWATATVYNFYSLPFWQIYPQFHQNLHQKDPLTIDYPYFYFGAERFDLIMSEGNNTYLGMERVEAE